MGRLIALILVIIPVFLSAMGIKWMRDSIFVISYYDWLSIPLQFLLGFIFFSIGFSLIGSFIFYRDKKNNKIKNSLRKTKQEENSPAN